MRAPGSGSCMPECRPTIELTVAGPARTQRTSLAPSSVGRISQAHAGHGPIRPRAQGAEWRVDLAFIKSALRNPRKHELSVPVISSATDDQARIAVRDNLQPAAR